MEHDFIGLLDPTISQTEITTHPNPFYVPMEGTNIRYTKNKILVQEYNSQYIYFVCFKNDTTNCDIASIFYDPGAELYNLTNTKDSITLVRGPFLLANYTKIRAGLTSVNSDVLRYFNHNNYELHDKELVYLMLHSKENTIASWLKLYETESVFDEYISLKILIYYLDLNDGCLRDYFTTFYNKIYDFKYWQNEKNCTLSINQAFQNRKFNIL